MPRTSIEYGGCSHTNRSRWRRSAVHWASTMDDGGKVDDHVAIGRGRAVDLAHQRRALERRVGRDAAQLEDRRRQVDAAPQDVDVPVG